MRALSSTYLAPLPVTSGGGAVELWFLSLTPPTDTTADFRRGERSAVAQGEGEAVALGVHHGGIGHAVPPS